MGLLTITGAKLDTRQFPPNGTSDADTVTLDVSNASFTFKPHAAAAGIDVTSLFTNATVNEKLCVSKSKTIRVRLQGIDAPEKSYQPQLRDYTYTDAQRELFNKFNSVCRQPLAEEAATALGVRLAQFGLSIDVRFQTSIGLPGDVIDSYGRFVGDVIVTQNNANLNINQWVVKAGWAFPAYYDSMEMGEIAALDAAWATGKAVATGVWSLFSGVIPPFDPPSTTEPIYPKLFRRQADWWAGFQAGLWSFSFPAYLAQNSEKMMLADEFAKAGRGAEKRDLATILTPGGSVTKDPECLIFLENDSYIRDRTGQFVSSWSARKKPAWHKCPTDEVWVNVVSISRDGSRFVGGTFKYDYLNNKKLENKYGIYCYDGTSVDGTNAGEWDYSYKGLAGVFTTAISADGSVAAAGGWMNERWGLLRIFDAQTGDLLLVDTTIPKRVNSISISADGKVVAAAAERVHVYVKQNGYYDELPITKTHKAAFKLDGSVKAVAVAPDGSWLVACAMNGEAMLATINNGKISKSVVWTAPSKPIKRTDPNSAEAPVPLLCATIAGGAQSFTVGGGDFLFVCTKAGMLANPAPQELDAWDTDAPVGKISGGAAENVRWLAMSDDGQTIAAVLNREIGSDKRGLLMVFKGGSVAPAWTVRLPHYPNSVSMDDLGQKIAVAYGFPEFSPGGFSLFDQDGNEQWHCPTEMMNWPIAVSADGSTIVGGCDDGKIYLFR